MGAGDGQSSNLDLVAHHDRRLGRSMSRDPLGSLDRPATPSRVVAAHERGAAVPT